MEKPDQELDHQVIYQKLGRDTFIKLVETFYDKVEEDKLLRTMYPEKLDMAKKKLYLFLIQKFGGPGDYSKLRGHPRMRRRHFKFPIGVRERNRWVSLMEASIKEIGINESEPVGYTLKSYFNRMATHMINKSELDISTD